MAKQVGLGRVFNVVPTASGLHIKLDEATAVTYVSIDSGSGDQVLTIKESIDGSSEANLNCDINPFVGDEATGTWAADSEQDHTFDLAAGLGSATLDTVVVTVGGDQLSDGFNCVEVTADSGTLVAILHDLTVQRGPANLASPVAA